jgi:hypothetical protein
VLSRIKYFYHFSSKHFNAVLSEMSESWHFGQKDDKIIAIIIGKIRQNKKVISQGFTDRGRGRNVEFHYYDWRLFSERRKCLFSWSQLRHHYIESIHLISIKVIRTSKIENINYLWHITYGYQCLDACWGLG